MKESSIAKTLMPRTWRSVATQERYEADRQIDLQTPEDCPLCAAETIEAFTHWRIIPNKYPYDAVAEKHEMLIPIRHCREEELTAAELKEYNVLKNSVINERYLYILEALPRTKSIPGHHHVHLMVPKTVD